MMQLTRSKAGSGGAAAPRAARKALRVRAYIQERSPASSGYSTMPKKQAKPYPFANQLEALRSMS